MTLTRRSLLAASVAVFGARAIAAPGATLTTLRLAGTPDIDVSSVIWQVPNGIFERNGLQIEGQRLSSGSAVAAAVVGGSIDVGSSSIFGLIVAHLKGLPFVLQAVQAVYDATAPNVGFVVAKNSPITAPAQLNGQTIATAALSDLFSAATSAWVDQNGGNSHTINFVEIPVPAQAAAIAAGRVAGALLVEPSLQDSIDGGQCRILGYPFNAIAPRFGATYYFCTASFAASNADTLARFRRAMAQEAAYAAAHKNEIYALAAKTAGMQLEMEQRLPWVLGSGIDLRTIQPVIDFAARYKFIPRSFPASELVDLNALSR